MRTSQHWTKSKDGTSIPYFVVHQQDREYNGTNPTLLFSYGGFRNSLTPSYSGSYEDLGGNYGKLWLERGGVFVLANIRGGNEFGNRWHQAAIKHNRHKAFEDFEAVAHDLIERKVTSPKHLAIEGRSNGGLLVSAVMVRRPELFGAVVCGSPVTDMLRFTKLSSGATWIAEWGDPANPVDRAYLRSYSPYHQVQQDQTYPPILFYSSTLDDRTLPGHARKLAAKMLDQGHQVYYFENMEGGHKGSSTNEQLAYRQALVYAFLWQQVGPHP